ncbi:MAG: RNA methyltransferase [Thermodesulfobacteriota bacterium]
MNLNSISIFLVRPRYHENIGSVARAMKNMGLNRLVVVDGASPLHRDAYRLASGAEDILERTEEFPNLKEAISETGCVVGTTSRAGKARSPLLTPRNLVEELIPISEKNSIGFVFGSEKEGLTNEELSLCHFYVRIPSVDSFPSLNLAQAVMVLCYELFQSSTTIHQEKGRLASAGHLERMFEHMERTLVAIGFLDAKHPERIMRVLRKIFGRSQMDDREVQILQGIWRKVDWYLRRDKLKVKS